MEAAMTKFLGRILGSAAAGLMLAAIFCVAPTRAGEPIPVDVELVLAVDISYSMDYDELALQRSGYVAAITSKQFLDALRQGAHGRIAVTYVEWAGSADQQVIVAWQLVDGPESAAAFANKLIEAPIRRAYRTSISGAIKFSAELFGRADFKGLRRVIDVSGDGTNNQGPLIEPTRDEVVAKGVTINGLPIMLKTPLASMIDIPNLHHYYEDCVIGGPGAFVVPVREREQFADAIKNKLVLEVSNLRWPQPSTPQVVPAVSPPRVSCTVGERMWQERWGR
jgi:hypothetical protein